MLDKEAKFITFVRENSEIGYGNMMSQISRIWHEKDPIGAFTTGPCYAQVEAYGSYFKLVDEVRQLREEVKRLSEKLERRTDESNAFQLKMTHKSAEIRQLTEERDKLVKALEWYADPATYDIDHLSKHGYIIIDRDGGERAQIVLSEIKGQGENVHD